MTSLQKNSLRQKLRARRHALNPAQQHAASRALDRHLRAYPSISQAKNIAFYLASDGEISPNTSLRRLSRQGRRCYLPCLRGNRLSFRRYRPGQTMAKNRFSIPEPPPKRGSELTPDRFDIIFLPLVGFDHKGNRLGMGGGFYDRTLSRLNGKRPLLIGLAHECQRVNQLPVQSWDIPLDAIATERAVYWFRKRQLKNC